MTGLLVLGHFQKISCIFGGTRSTLETSVFISLGKRSTRRSRCVFLQNRIVRAASSGDNAQITWQAWGMGVPFDVADAAFGKDDMSCVQLVQYLGHSTLYT